MLFTHRRMRWQRGEMILIITTDNKLKGLWDYNVEWRESTGM